MDEEPHNKYDDSEEINEDEINIQEVRLDPESLFVNTLFKMQNALVKDDIKAGLIQFRMLVEHAEMLAIAMNKLDADYEQEVEAFKKTPEYLDEKLTDDIRSARLANKKAGLLLKGYMKYRPATAAMKL